MNWPIYWNSKRLKKYVLSKSKRIESQINELQPKDGPKNFSQKEIDDKYGRLSFYKKYLSQMDVMPKEELLHNLNLVINHNIAVTDYIINYKVTDIDKSYKGFVDECLDFVSICDIFYD